MTPLHNYQNDGACAQAKATLAFLQPCRIEKSWDKERMDYLAQPNVSRWENCREQGYVVTMRSKTGKNQINIAFFEHRNSDSIHAVKWNQCPTNAPTIDTAQFGDVYKDKYDTSHSVQWGEAAKMAHWIHNELEKFWEDAA